MCDVLESYAAKAREEGMAAGMRAGREEGMAAGMRAGREEGMAAGRAEGIATGRAEILNILNITPEEFERICKEKKLQSLT